MSNLELNREKNMFLRSWAQSGLLKSHSVYQLSQTPGHLISDCHNRSQNRIQAHQVTIDISSPSTV